MRRRRWQAAARRAAAAKAAETAAPPPAAVNTVPLSAPFFTFATSAYTCVFFLACITQCSLLSSSAADPAEVAYAPPRSNGGLTRQVAGHVARPQLGHRHSCHMVCRPPVHSTTRPGAAVQRRRRRRRRRRRWSGAELACPSARKEAGRLQRVLRGGALRGVHGLAGGSGGAAGHSGTQHICLLLAASHARSHAVQQQQQVSLAVWGEEGGVNDYVENHRGWISGQRGKRVSCKPAQLLCAPPSRGNVLGSSCDANLCSPASTATFGGQEQLTPRLAVRLLQHKDRLPSSACTAGIPRPT
jgi:hypothetical protein